MTNMGCDVLVKVFHPSLEILGSSPVYGENHIESVTPHKGPKEHDQNLDGKKTIKRSISNEVINYNYRRLILTRSFKI